MSRICNLILVALVAASFVIAGSAFAQDGPKVSGNVGFGFGTYTESPSQATGGTAPDIEGYTGSWESNLFVQGNNGPLDYRYRIRLRGVDRPEATGGPTNSLADNEPQTVRGFIGWQVNDAFKIRIAKPAVSIVTSTAENDPVQNNSYAFTGDLFDQVQINFLYKAGGNLFGATLSPQTPSAQSTSGAASSGSNGDHEVLTLELYTKLKFGGIGVNLKLNTSEGTEYSATSPQSFESSGVQAHVAVPAGPAKINFDFEDNTSDVAGATATGPLGEYNVTFIAVKVVVQSIYIGFATTETETVSSTGTVSSGNTKTNMNIHYRIPTGKGGWVGPEFSSVVTADDTTNPDTDEEITTIRWLQVVKF